MSNKHSPLPDPLVTCSPKRLSGAPVFAGTRVPVRTLFDYLAAGETLSEFLRQFPDVSQEHAVAVLGLAAARVSDIEGAAHAA